MAFRASAVNLFRATAVTFSRNLKHMMGPFRTVAPDAPTQLILRSIADGGPQSVHQLWGNLEATGKFRSKKVMKHSLDFLRRKGRVECKPQDPKDHTLNFVYYLGETPKVIPLEEESSA